MSIGTSQIIQRLKDNQIDPWDIEMSVNLDKTDLPKHYLITDKEYKALKESTNLKLTIFKVYYSNTMPELPETIKNLLKRAKEETTYPGWGLILDWSEGVDDYDFDDPMCNFVKINNNARKVYGYLLALELQKQLISE